MIILELNSSYSDAGCPAWAKRDWKLLRTRIQITMVQKASLALHSVGQTDGECRDQIRGESRV